MYMNILLTRASSYKSCLLLDLPPLRDYFVVSFHMMIIENGPVDPGTINEGGHQPTGSMRGHIPRQARATRLLTRSMQRWEFPKIYLTAVVFILNNTRGASPRRDDARFCSAHARNYRGCRQIEAVNVTQYVLPRGTINNKSRLMKRRTTLGSDSMNQQQEAAALLLQQQQYSNSRLAHLRPHTRVRHGHPNLPGCSPPRDDANKKKTTSMTVIRMAVPTQSRCCRRWQRRSSGKNNHRTLLAIGTGEVGGGTRGTLAP